MAVKMLFICRSSPDLWSKSHHRNRIMIVNILNMARTHVCWSVQPKRFMLCVSDAEKIVIDRHKRDCGFYNESKILHESRGLHVFYCHDAMITIIIHLLKQAKACRSRSNIPFFVKHSSQKRQTMPFIGKPSPRMSDICDSTS